MGLIARFVHTVNGRLAGAQVLGATYDAQWMVPLQSGGGAGEPRATDPHVYEVEVFGPTTSLRGRVRAPSSARLSDFVNEREPFLALSSGERPADFSEKSVSSEAPGSWLVGKNNVELICEVSHAATETGRSDLRVFKQPRRVRVQTPRFHVEGDLHLADGADLSTMVVNSRARFLAATRAVVAPLDAPADTRAFYPFVLLNRDQIVLLTELPA